MHSTHLQGNIAVGGKADTSRTQSFLPVGHVSSVLEAGGTLLEVGATLVQVRC